MTTKPKGGSREVAPETASGGWLPLWLFTKTIAPETCRLAIWWVSDPPIAGVDRAKAIAQKRHPRLRDWQLYPKHVTEVLDERMKMRQRLGTRLLSVDIPFRLRRVLAGGGFDVIATNASGKEVRLTPRDIVGLDIDLEKNTMTGDGTVYTAVRIRRASPKTAVADKPKRGRQPGQTKYDWHAFDAAIMQRLLADGVPKDGDGGKAAFAKHGLKKFNGGPEPTFSVVKARVAKLIAEYERDLLAAERARMLAKPSSREI